MASRESHLAERIALYPCSGEINYSVQDAAAAIKRVSDSYRDQSPLVDETDGLSLAFDSWRMNLRSSNTESLLRLNVETKANDKTLWDHVSALEKLIGKS